MSDWWDRFKTTRSNFEFVLKDFDSLSLHNDTKKGNTTGAEEANRSYTQNAVEVQPDSIIPFPRRQKVIVAPKLEQFPLVKATIELLYPGNVVPKALALEKQMLAEIKPVEKIDYAALAKQFCQWFFWVLNSQNPIFGEMTQPFGPHLFWENAELKFYSFLRGQEAVQEAHGAARVSLFLLSLLWHNKFHFNPTLESHGLSYMVSPHGKVTVSVSGSIQRDHTFVGVFDQIFELICSRPDNNWKIKYVNMALRQ